MATTNELIAASSVRFGTSGARGLVDDLTDTVCFAFTLSFLDTMAPAPGSRVALAIDLRPSSPRIASACAAAIRHAGYEVDYCGAIPTPALAYYAMQMGIPALMVTGSHIPFDRNGIKFYRSTGEISKTDEQAIMAACLPLPDAIAGQDLPEVNYRARQGYINRYLDFFPGKPLRGSVFGFYEHSSLARDVLREIIEQLGARVISLGRTDAFVPIDTEAVSLEDIHQARSWAEEFSLDAIFSTDGDADRPLLGDELGNWLRGDVVGLMCARELGARAVVTPVSSNTAVESCGAFNRVLRTRIGSPYVIAGMEALMESGEESVVGFEANGGFLVGTPIIRDGRVLSVLPTRDAALPIIALLVATKTRSILLSRLVAELPQRFTASARLQNFPVERSRKLLAKLSASRTKQDALLSAFSGSVVSQDETDGLRLTCNNDEIVHIRPSGNAPELRCYAEATHPMRATFLAHSCLKRLTKLR